MFWWLVVIGGATSEHLCVFCKNLWLLECGIHMGQMFCGPVSVAEVLNGLREAWMSCQGKFDR